MSNVLTASGLLSRRMSVEWHEAVALVRAVIECLIRDGGRSSDVPELDQIEIAPDGHVTVVGVTRTNEPVRRLGQLLQALFGQSGPPVQLRLVISQAMATHEAFDSIHEFDQALGYFEPPDRGAVLQALYVRAAAAPLSEVQSPLTLDTVAPVLDPQQQEERKRIRAARRRVLWRSIAAGFLGVLCVAGVQYARQAGMTPSAPDVIANARQIADVVDASVLTGLSAMTEVAGFGRIIPADSTGEESADAAAPPSLDPAQPTASRRPRAQAAASREGSQTPADAPGPQEGLVVAFDLAPATVAPVPAAAPAVLSNTVSGVANEAALTVYSDESPGVVPPVGVRPVLPTELPPDLRLEDLLFIGVTVLPDGSVGAVKLLGTPRNMQEGMWLSAVKAFEFLPASKDGVPVSFRKNIWIAPR